MLASITVLALAACGPTREQEAAEVEAAAAAEAEAIPLDALPPPITASGTYRCADNTILYVDFYGTNQGASIRVGEMTATPVRVSAPTPAAGETEATGPATSEDGQTSLSGSGDQINVKLAGKGAQTCKS